jgi:IS30 family transposase
MMAAEQSKNAPKMSINEKN